MHFYKKLIFSLIVCISAIGNAQAQFVELGFMLGASNYMGDLSREQIVLKETHFSAAVYGRYNISKRWAVKGFGAYGSVSGDDKNFNDVAFNKLRNLNFSSDIYEFSLQMEFNLLKNNLRDNSARPFIPYLFAGLGVFNFNPKTTLGGVTYELQPLGTEGQGSTAYNDLKKYDLTTICVPVGVGFRKKIGEAFFLGIEGGIRLTGTNYIDDVGGNYVANSIIRGATGPTAELLADRSWENFPLGAPTPVYPGGTPQFQFKDGDVRSERSVMKTDSYLMVGITLSYVFRGKGIPCPQF